MENSKQMPGLPENKKSVRVMETLAGKGQTEWRPRNIQRSSKARKHVVFLERSQQIVMEIQSGPQLSITQNRCF